MGFLICNKCGGYYELQEGESPEDFAGKCDCGGDLKYVQNLDEHVFDELDPIDGINICPNCGKENKNNVNFCSDCGENLYRENPESHDGLMILGYILAVIGPFTLLIATIIAIVIGYKLYKSENPKYHRNGKYIIIIALIMALLIAVLYGLLSLLIYNAYFSSQSYNPPNEDIETTRNAAYSMAFILNNYF